jgi:hypothetical protein
VRQKNGERDGRRFGDIDRQHDGQLVEQFRQQYFRLCERFDRQQYFRFFKQLKQRLFKRLDRQSFRHRGRFERQFLKRFDRQFLKRFDRQHDGKLGALRHRYALFGHVEREGLGY